MEKELSPGEVILRFIGFIILAQIIILLLVFSSIWFSAKKSPPEDYCYSTTNVADYGNYTGTNNNHIVKTIISSFFPEEIPNFSENVNYSYRADNINSYGFEAYLELMMPDSDIFYDYVEDIGSKNRWMNFSFDPSYRVLILDNQLDIDEDSLASPESNFYHPIERAKIRIILINPETQTVIFWALGVYDGGAIGTNFLNSFFDRFDIDPVIYELTADSPYGKDPYEID